MAPKKGIIQITADWMSFCVCVRLAAPATRAEQAVEAEQHDSDYSD
jgi:hypothetical protein